MDASRDTNTLTKGSDYSVNGGIALDSCHVDNCSHHSLALSRATDTDGDEFQADTKQAINKQLVLILWEG